MAIVVVGGSGRNVGKTELVCGLIAALKELRWTAVKVTSHEHWSIEPVWEENEPGQRTDTARYLAAGARRAFLLTAPEWQDPNETGLGLTLGEFFRRAGRGTNVIFESNRVLYHVQPSLCLMVQPEEDAGQKPSFARALHCADATVARTRPNGSAQPAAVAAELTRPFFQLPHFGQFSPAMEGWLRQRLGLQS